jgi:chromosome segregation ATPase
MKFENRQLYVAIKKWRNETKPKTMEYTNIINNLTANNNDLLASLENEREKHRTMTKEWEKRLEVEKNKYSNASKKVLQQEAMLMSIRRDLEEKIRYNTQVEVNNIKDISSYKDTIINKDAEMDILKKQLTDSRIAIEASNKREEELQNKLMIENEKEIRFKEKYDEWMSSREALIQSVEQSQSALSLALEREATLTSSCEEYRSIINSLKKQVISLDKKVTTCNEQIGIIIITIIIVILIDIIATQETDLSNAKTGNDSKTKELEEASNLNSKLMKRLQDTQRAFEESLTELSSLSKKYNDMSKQKDVYCNTINSLRLCVRKMQESLQGIHTLFFIVLLLTINIKLKKKKTKK